MGAKGQEKVFLCTVLCLKFIPPFKMGKLVGQVEDEVGCQEERDSGNKLGDLQRTVVHA